jgi:hypothetical protein
MTKRVVVAVNDLMLAPRILEAAKKLGAEARRAGSPEAVLDACQGAETLAVVVDLHDELLRPRELFAALGEVPGVTSIGYHGHLMPELGEAARAAGCALTFSRGELVRDLANVLRRALG